MQWTGHEGGPLQAWPHGPRGETRARGGLKGASLSFLNPWDRAGQPMGGGGGRYVKRRRRG